MTRPGTANYPTSNYLFFCCISLPEMTNELGNGEAIATLELESKERIAKLELESKERIAIAIAIAKLEVESKERIAKAELKKGPAKGLK